jgi:hypothetical protein
VDFSASVELARKGRSVLFVKLSNGSIPAVFLDVHDLLVHKVKTEKPVFLRWRGRLFAFQFPRSTITCECCVNEFEDVKQEPQKNAQAEIGSKIIVHN